MRSLQSNSCHVWIVHPHFPGVWRQISNRPGNNSNKYIILKKIILYHNLSLFVAFGGQSFALIYMY